MFFLDSRMSVLPVVNPPLISIGLVETAPCISHRLFWQFIDTIECIMQLQSRNPVLPDLVVGDRAIRSGLGNPFGSRVAPASPRSLRLRLDSGSSASHSSKRSSFSHESSRADLCTLSHGIEEMKPCFQALFPPIHHIRETINPF
jgi:hypothetical protein